MARTELTVSGGQQISYIYLDGTLHKIDLRTQEQKDFDDAMQEVEDFLKENRT